MWLWRWPRPPVAVDPLQAPIHAACTTGGLKELPHTRYSARSPRNASRKAMRIASVQIVFSNHSAADSRYFMVNLLVEVCPVSGRHDRLPANCRLTKPQLLAGVCTVCRRQRKRPHQGDLAGLSETGLRRLHHARTPPSGARLNLIGRIQDPLRRHTTCRVALHHL